MVCRGRGRGRGRFFSTYHLRHTTYLLCFQQHSRFTLAFSTAVLCFHRHPRLVRSLFKINSESQFGGGHGYLLEVLEFLRVFAQHHPAKAGQAEVFGQGVSAVLQCIELRVLLGGCGARSGGMLRIPARGGEQPGRQLG